MKNIPVKIKAIIKMKAESEWPDDFEMQYDVVEKQSSAYKSIESMKSSCTNNVVFNKTLKKACEEWSDDFEMQLHTIKNQLEAAMKMAQFSDLTGDKCFELKEEGQDEWTDEDMQMYFYRVNGAG